MITFLVCLAILIGGYFIYGTYVDLTVGVNTDNLTPAVKLQDNIDYVPMPWWKVFLIQFLNIAGTGPIFGAISGALFGPVAFLWITFGTIFAGAVHDYLSGVISMKHNGGSVSELVGIYLGKTMRAVMVFLSYLINFSWNCICQFSCRIISQYDRTELNILDSYHYSLLHFSDSFTC